MNIYILISILALSYTFFYIFNKILLNKYTVREILVNSYILCSIIVIFLFYNDLVSSIKKFDVNFIYLIALALSMVIGDSLLTYGCGLNYNFGLIEGIAMGMYVPLVAIISYFYFNDKLTISNFIGLLLIGIGVILASK
jgi:uncharacterized membrane protein